MKRDPRDSSTESTIDIGRQVLEIEADALRETRRRLGPEFQRAVDLILNSKGRVVTTGIGKSGAVARKIASTFASTGTPALFLHAAEGLHGDLGMVTDGDVLVAVSYSGRTEDLMNILPVIRSMKVPIIAISGNRRSSLAHQADVVLDGSVRQEACPLNLAPTASTTVALALGDALAVAVMTQRGFTRDDFARFHPGGTLGRGLHLRVADLMRTGERFATVPHGSTVRDALFAITKAQAGAAAVLDGDGHLAGIVTDGDIRRYLVREDGGLDTAIADVMTPTPVVVNPDMPAVDALRLMEEKVVDDLPVVDDQHLAVGMLDVQDLLRGGLA